MKTILELMTALSANETIIDGARIAIQSGLAGAKDIYLAWGKEMGNSLKYLNEEWKKAEEEIRPAKRAGATGFAGAYYDWLASGSHTEQEARDYIMSPETSANTKAHLTHYLNIWALCETVRAGYPILRTMVAEKGETPADEAPKAAKAKEPVMKEGNWTYDPAHPFADDKSAAETLLRQKNLVAKKRDLATLLVGAEMEGPSQKGFQVILNNTKKTLGKE